MRVGLRRDGEWVLMLFLALLFVALIYIPRSRALTQQESAPKRCRNGLEELPSLLEHGPSIARPIDSRSRSNLTV